MRKMDEMERDINDRSIKHSWLFGIIALAILNFYRQITQDALGIDFIIMLMMLIIYRLSSFIQHHKKGNEEAKNALIWTFVTVILTLMILYIIRKYF